MSRKVFLIDYENTAIRGLRGIDELESGSKIVIFCSSESIMTALESILKVYEEKGIDIKLHFLTKKGNNALDFMITTYLGYEISKEDVNEIYILSKDRGYSSALELAKSLKENVKIGFEENIYFCLHEEEKIQTSKETLYNEEISIKQIIDNAVINIEKSKKQNQKKAKSKETNEILQKIEADGLIPSKYTRQLASVIMKSVNINDFKARAIKLFGMKNKDYIEIALKYYNLKN